MNPSLIEKLRKVDEVLLLELLDLNSSDIVDAFTDRIDERANYIYGQLEEENE
mgnify:FL=1